MPLLEVKDVHAYYGNIHALKGVSLTVEKGEIVTLIGGNGAGKTTTLRTITGLMRPRDGRVMFDGEEVAKLPAHDWVSRGIAMVPEGRGVFARLTAEENLEMGAYHRKDKAGIKADIEKSYQMFPRLGERRTQLAGTMSGGEQQMLAVTRALMSKPRLASTMARSSCRSVATRCRRGCRNGSGPACWPAGRRPQSMEASAGWPCPA